MYYGGLVASPIYKKIAEKVFSTNMDFQKEINAKPNALTKMPSVIKNKSEDLEGTLTKLNIPHKSAQGSKWASTNPADSSKIDLQPVLIEESLEKGIVPNLIGLSGRDAVYLLENKGFTVQLSGFGTVKKQSIEAGKKFNKGSFIVITLG